MGRERVLVLEQLTKRFRRNGKPVLALDDCSLEIDRGDAVVLRGPNGAGKSTVLRVAAGLVCPEAGRVVIAGRGGEDSGRGARLGAMLDGGATLYARLTVRENIAYFAALKGIAAREARQRAARLLPRFGLLACADELFQSLSRGRRQRVAVICHVIHDPPVLLLDEPSLGLDEEAQSALADLLMELRAGGTAILLASHAHGRVEGVATRVAFMEHGRIAARECIP